MSSFYWAMRLLPRPRREPMFALYGYCRMLDDIADGPEDPAIKRARLAVMRGAVAALFESGMALDPALAALAPSIARFHLPRAELEALIEGMEMDVNAPLTAPNMEQLRHYCRCVAGSVGMLAVHILGRPDAESLAAPLGEALQLTNILRDVAEDAEWGRLYLPAEILTQAGISLHSPRAVLSHPALPHACRLLGDLAEARFAEAQSEFDRLGGKGLWPAKVMMATYRAQLANLSRHGWRALPPPPRLSKVVRLLIALRCLVLGR